MDLLYQFFSVFNILIDFLGSSFFFSDRYHFLIRGKSLVPNFFPFLLLLQGNSDPLYVLSVFYRQFLALLVIIILLVEYSNIQFFYFYSQVLFKYYKYLFFNIISFKVIQSSLFSFYSYKGLQFLQVVSSSILPIIVYLIVIIIVYSLVYNLVV